MIKAQRERERRQANNARERYIIHIRNIRRVFIYIITNSSMLCFIDCIYIYIGVI